VIITPIDVSVTRASSQTVTWPTTSPIASPPIATMRNVPLASSSENAPAAAAAIANR
jgi:hypothetical protein